MFKDDSINLTYKRLQSPETNDKSVKGLGWDGGGGTKYKQFNVVTHRYSRGTAGLDLQWVHYLQ